MQVRDVMSTHMVTATPRESVVAVAKKMVDHGISGLPVLDDAGELVGMVSEGDLIHRAELGTESRRPWWLDFFSATETRAEAFLKAHGTIVADVMSRDLATVQEDAGLDTVARVLEERRVKRLPVMRGKKLVGIVSRADLLRALAHRALKPTPTAGDDREIRARFNDELARAGISGASLVNPIVENGTMHLWGLVESAAEHRAVEALAREIVREDKVVNHLRLRSIVLDAM